MIHLYIFLYNQSKVGNSLVADRIDRNRIDRNVLDSTTLYSRLHQSVLKIFNDVKILTE